jgi:hypothetical protein
MADTCLHLGLVRKEHQRFTTGFRNRENIDDTLVNPDPNLLSTYIKTGKDNLSCFFSSI